MANEILKESLARKYFDYNQHRKKLIEWEKSLSKKGDGTFTLTIDDEYTFKMHPTMEIHILKTTDPGSKIKYLLWGDGAYSFYQMNKEQLEDYRRIWSYWNKEHGGMVIREHALWLLNIVVNKLHDIQEGRVNLEPEKDYDLIAIRIESTRYIDPLKLLELQMVNPIMQVPSAITPVEIM